MIDKQRKAYAAGIAAAMLGVLILAEPQAASRGFASGTALCLERLLPALFPFMVVCELLAEAPLPGRALLPVQKLLGLETPEAVRAVLLAWLGGYAVSARLANSVWEKSPQDAHRVLLLGCCSGPGFVIGSVGGLMLRNVSLGLLLYGLQLAANLFAVACCVPFMPRNAGPHRMQDSQATKSFAGLPGAIAGAVSSSLSVCGCVVFFRLVGAVLCAAIPLPQSLISAVMEVSSGCADFAALGGRAALYGCCLCLSLPGLSVWSQMQMLAGRAFCPKLLLLSRGLHLIFLQVLIRLLVSVLPGKMAVYSSLPARTVPMLRLPPDAAILGVCFLCAALYKLRQNLYNDNWYNLQK